MMVIIIVIIIIIIINIINVYHPILVPLRSRDQGRPWWRHYFIQINI